VKNSNSSSNPIRYMAVLAALVMSQLLAISIASADSVDVDSGHSATPTLDRINRTGALKIGVSGAQPPFSMTAKSGDVIGLDVDLGNALAASMGVDAKFVVMDFADLIPAVEAGTVDIALSGLTITPERNRRVAFAGPYFLSGKGLLTTSAALAKADDPSDLSGGPHTFVALKDSTSFGLIESLGGGVKAVGVSDYATGIQQVIKGKADAMVADYPVCVVALFQNPDAGLESIISPFTFEPLGAAVAPNDALFLNLVQNYMNTLEGIGLMGILRAKWFENGDWIVLLP
jgi:polar amino acid transport system substrate-binding protein